MEEIAALFPDIVKKKILKRCDDLEEIRVRVNKPIILRYGQAEEITECCLSWQQIFQILQKLCENSIYSYQEQICNGYITVKGGHRIGITGSVVMKDNKVINISHISSLNFRIAKEVIGCSKKILKYIIDIDNNSILNTIIVSPPGFGKTTLLRDIVRNLSNGIPDIGFKGVNIGVADERSEIAAMYNGIPQNDIGIRTDVLANIPKSIGMKMLIRSMNPKVVVADEIGSKEDIDVIHYAICSGVKGIFTAHGKDMKEFLANPILKTIYNSNMIERLLFIDKNRNITLQYDRFKKSA